MTNRNRFFINGALLSVVGLSVRTVGLVFGAFVSRAIGAEGMGLYTLIMTVYSFALTFATSGISLTVTRLVASSVGKREGRDVGGILRGALVYALLFSGAATLALGALSDTLSRVVIRDARACGALGLLSFSLIPAALGAVFSGYFIGVKRVGANAVVQVSSQLVKVVITVVLVTRVARHGTESAVLALALGIVIAELAAFLLVFIQFTVDRMKHKATCRGIGIKPVFGMALPLAFSAYIRSALVTLEHVLIPKRLTDGGRRSSESLASYGALHGMALPVVLYPMSMLSSFSGMLVPEFADGSSLRRRRHIASEVLNTTLAYAVAVAVFLYAFSEELGYTLYNSYEAGIYIALVAPIVPIMYLDHVTDSMLKGIGEHVYSMWVNITDSLLSVVLVWLLIPKMGVAGYALVIIIMEMFNFTLSLIRLRGRVGFELSPLRALFLPLSSATVAVILSKRIFVMSGSATEPLWLILKMIFAASVFFTFVIATRAAGSFKRAGKNEKSV